MDRDQRRGDGFCCRTGTDISHPYRTGADCFQYIVDAVGGRAIARHEECTAACFKHSRRPTDGTIQHHTSGPGDCPGMSPLVLGGQGCSLNDDLPGFEGLQNAVGAFQCMPNRVVIREAGKNEIRCRDDLCRGGSGNAAGGDKRVHRAATIAGDGVSGSNEVLRHREPHAADAD